MSEQQFRVEWTGNLKVYQPVKDDKAEMWADYDKWCEANPGECTLCNPHQCDEWCPCEPVRGTW